MKRLLAVIVAAFFALSMLSAPAMAHHKDGHEQGNSKAEKVKENNGKGDNGRNNADPDGGGKNDDAEGDDGNNGCGNDSDFSDDNNGNCGGKDKPVKDKPTKPETPKPTPTPSPEPTEPPVDECIVDGVDMCNEDNQPEIPPVKNCPEGYDTLKSGLCKPSKPPVKDKPKTDKPVSDKPGVDKPKATPVPSATPTPEIGTPVEVDKPKESVQNIPVPTMVDAGTDTLPNTGAGKVIGIIIAGLALLGIGIYFLRRKS